MTISEAVKILTAELRPFDWFQAAGIKGSQIVIYLNSKPKDKRRLEELTQAGYEGFDVSSKFVGQLGLGDSDE